MAKSFKTPRSTGTRTLTYGLLRCDVGMGPLSDSTSRRSANICFEKDGVIAKAKQAYTDPATGEVVETIKAYAHGDGFVVVEKDELPKLAADRVITLAACVDDSDVPFEFIEKTNLIWPDDDASLPVFALLTESLRDERKALIGTTVDGGTTKTLIVRYSARFETLVCHVAGYVENVRQGNVDLARAAAATAKVPEGASAMLRSLLEALGADFDFSSVEDAYAKVLDKVIEAKSDGRVLKVEETVEEPAAGADVMAMLEASLAQVKAA